MTIHLQDIIDLDYLLSLDNQRDSVEEKNEILARDREIFTQLNPAGLDSIGSDQTGLDQTGLDPGEMTDRDLLFSWLEYRRLVFFHQSPEGPSALLPGRVFSSLYRWVVCVLVITGFLSGISMAYSFLAYHGTRPVNVTIFFAVFIFLHLLLFFITLFVLANRFFARGAGNRMARHSVVHTLLSWFFFGGLPGILKRLGRPMGEKGTATIEYTASLIQMRNREYRFVFFWPFFLLSSFFATAFSAGALGGTLFRVAVSDMAFGWQSTLMTASDRIHDALSVISLPWSWFVPASLAYPNLEQIEGSRILLKEGIASLATKDLVSWWPFLCLGIFFYAVLPRLILILLGGMAQRRAVDQFDFERPRFKKLLIRMQSPIMDIRFDEAPVSRAGRQNPPADPSVADVPGIDPLLPEGSGGETVLAEQRQFKGSHAMVLVPGSVYGEKNLGAVPGVIRQNLFLEVRSTISLSFDYSADKALLAELAATSSDQVVLLQEVWQPPIRGLVHYFVQLKTQIFTDRPLWILLTQTPGEEPWVVDGEDMNFKVWKQAIHQLGNPDILLERVYK
jgi:Protein of unknown function (DUF2868)